MGKDTCRKGVVANQQQSCPDISAVGIQSITQSADLTKLYITLTNGQTTTYTLPTQAPLPILYGTGAPANSLGALGQTYIDTASGNVYLKTSASAWTFELNIIGATGAAGAAGANGTSVLYNDQSETTSGTATGAIVLKTFSLPANTLATDGSFISILTSVVNIDADAVDVGVSVGGISIGDFNADSAHAGQQFVFIEAEVNRTTSTSGIFTTKISVMDATGLVVASTITLPTVISLAFAGAITLSLTVSPRMPGATGVLSRQFQVTNYKL